jgi:hypothetical protein
LNADRAPQLKAIVRLFRASEGNMNINNLVLLGAVLACSLTAEAQQSITRSSQTSAPAVAEPVDASFVPVVESKSQALEVVSVTRRDPFIRIRLKNNSDKNIYAFRMRYHKGGVDEIEGTLHEGSCQIPRHNLTKRRHAADAQSACL